MGFRVVVGAESFSPHHRVQTESGAHPASYPMCTSGYFHGVKQLGREADQSLPSSAEVKNEWGYSSTPPVRFYGLVPRLKKHRDNFTYTLPLPPRN
jgi:hypothetical protein